MKFRKLQRAIKLAALALLGFADAIAINFFLGSTASINCSASAITQPIQQILPSFLIPLFKLTTPEQAALLCRLEIVLPLLLQAWIIFGLSGAIATFVLTTDLPTFIWQKINRFRAERLIQQLEKANQTIDQIDSLALDPEQLTRLHLAIDSLSTP